MENENNKGTRKVFLAAGICQKCGDRIVSKSRHDFVKCSCGACYVDGGWDYHRFSGPIKTVTEERTLRPLTEEEKEKHFNETMIALCESGVLRHPQEREKKDVK